MFTNRSCAFLDQNVQERENYRIMTGLEPVLEIYPIDTLYDLLSWKKDGNLLKIVQNIRVYTREDKAQNQPFTLICHDMCNGYLDDRFVFGSQNYNAYRFYHWSGVDIFVYFSHHFVTIPPVGWINAAHLHGVKVLGTLITEWDEGAKIWAEILSSEEIMVILVENLVAIADFYRFDGWLINIENVVAAEKIDTLVQLMIKLKAKMHESSSQSLIIWYDSVTKDGKLDWQNELNGKNSCFFDACDCIFLNYTWNEENLVHSITAAKTRKFDVYVGIDVYGRNFYEGGKFNTYKAVRMARKHNLSVAIFAQGWTYEVLGMNDFFANETALWANIVPLLHHRGPEQLPFKTSFCQGFGKKCFANGKCVSDSSWADLSKLQIQPIWSQNTPGLEMILESETAFSGGGCLIIRCDGERTCKIFENLFTINHNVKVIVTCKFLHGSDCPCIISLILDDCNSDENRRVDLWCPGESSSKNDARSIRSTCISEARHEIISGWLRREYKVECGKKERVQQIAFQSLGTSQILLGELCVDYDTVK